MVGTVQKDQSGGLWYMLPSEAQNSNANAVALAKL